MYQHVVADPSVAKTADGYVMVSTGDDVPRAFSTDGVTWTWGPPALDWLPYWVSDGGSSVWAAEIARIGGQWVLYYSAQAGDISRGRCIGVATSPTADGEFTPVSETPLVCNNVVNQYAEDDVTTDAASGTPGNTTFGVIDPSVFTDVSGNHWLLFKTQGSPSSIRILPLTADGLHLVPGTDSVQLVSAQGTIENPVVRHVGAYYYLFDSVGNYGTCGYKTVWRRATSLLGLSAAQQHPLLTQANTGLCGPGGADVIPVPSSGMRMYFAAWTCGGTPKPCAAMGSAAVSPGRALYAGNLAFSTKGPRITSYVTAPIAPTGCTGSAGTPSGSPTASPTGSPSDSPSGSSPCPSTTGPGTPSSTPSP